MRKEERRWLALCYFLSLALVFWTSFVALAVGNNVYIAQTAAGLANGSSCANAVAQTYFNSSGNWSATPTGIQIGPDTTVHLCGTFTEAAGASGTLTAQGSGTSGHPVRIQFETSANATAPYWGSGGFITINGKGFIQIDGSPTSTPCGYVNSIDVSCNGIIQATANGASLANHVSNSHAISLGSGTHDIELRNFDCENLFVAVQNSANNEKTSGINNSACVWWFPSGGGGGGNINTHNIKFNYTFNGVLYAYQGSNAGMHADNSWGTNIDVCAQIGAGTSGASITSGSWNNNDCSNMNPWDTPGDANHHEFIHLYTQQSGATISNFTIAGNYLHGTLGGFMTAEIYVECDGGSQCTAPTSINVAEYNNVIVNEDPNADISTGAGGNGMNECEGSTCQIYQNTYFSLAHYSSDNFAQHVEAGGVITAKGNIFDGMNQSFANGGGTINASTNLGYGLNVACGAPCTVSTNPLLNLSSSPPYQLQSGSSAIAAALNLTSLGISGLDSDQLGAARPPVGNWDMGAFNITGTSPGISFTPTSLTFASQIQGTTSAPQNVVVKNTGTATLLISSVSITGTNSGDFGQSNNCGGGISAGGSCTIAVTFTPSATGARSASVSVADNAAGSPQTVGLSGTGATATAGTSFSPTSLSFGSQPILTTSAGQAVTLTNTGSGTLTVSLVAITGTNNTDFAQTNTCTSVAPSGTCTITATFRPTATGSRSANISVTDNATGSPQTVPLTGTGTSAAVTLVPSSIVFGNQTTGTTSQGQSIKLTNTGSATLTISGISITGTNPTQFGQTNNCGASISVSGSCTITATFSPTSAASFSANVSIADNASGSPQTVPLTGTGVTATAQIVFTPTSLAFGSVPVLTTSTQQTFTVFNPGSATLNISSIALTGTNSADFAIVAPQGMNARADQTAQPYNANAGTIPCPGSNGCSAVIIASISVTGTAGTVTFQHTFGSCPFGAATTVQINGDTLLAENKLHTIATCSTTGFTYNDGAGTGSGTDGVASSTGGALVGAGTVIPSDFPNVTLTRVTDNLTPSITGGATPGKNGWAVTTTGSSETCQFDVGNHMFVAQLAGNSSYAFSLNPATGATAIMYGGAQIDPNGGHEPTCSRVTPYLFYNAELVGGDLSIVSYNFSGAVNPTGTQVVDLNTACGASLPSGLVASNDEPVASTGDTIFSFIGQTTPGQNNSAIYAGAYNLSTSTCYVWNRSSGLWYINGVSQGYITIYNTGLSTNYSSSLDPQSIHQLRMSPNGQTLSLSTEALLGSQPTSYGGYVFWPIGTSSAYASQQITSPNTNAGNHTAMGNSVVAFMRADCPTFCDSIYTAPLTNPYGSTLLNYVPGDPVGGDRHIGWANDFDDTQVFCGGHTNDTPGQYQSFLVPYAWNNEFTCTDPVSGRMYRLTHNYVSATVQAIFNSAANVSTVSQDGKFALFTSDHGCLLGARDGVSAKANCTNNGTVNGRTDIFLVRLPNSAVACGATLAAGQTCEVGVTFRPSAAGSRTANVSFADNAASSPQTVTLTGTGTSSAAVSLSPSSLTFGPQALTTTSASQQVNLYNVGGTTLSISGITITGTNSGDFAQTNNCGSSVLAGGSCSIFATFTPSANGARSASISIADSAAGSPQTVPMTGTGFTATPAVSIVPSSLIFATQTVGSPSNGQAIIVTNTGTATVTFSSISLTGTNAGDYGQTNTCGSSLAVGQPCSIIVTFMPTAAGTRTANVSIADNVSGSPQLVPLTGTGVTGPLVAPDPGMFSLLYDAAQDAIRSYLRLR